MRRAAAYVWKRLRDHADPLQALVAVLAILGTMIAIAAGVVGIVAGLWHYLGGLGGGPTTTTTTSALTGSTSPGELGGPHLKPTTTSSSTTSSSTTSSSTTTTSTTTTTTTTTTAPPPAYPTVALHVFECVAEIGKHPCRIGNLWTTVEDFSNEPAFRPHGDDVAQIYRERAPGTSQLYKCFWSSDSNVEFISLDSGCSGHKPAGETMGFVYAIKPTNVAVVPLYACAVPTGFVGSTAACTGEAAPGSKANTPLGYAPAG